MNQKNFLSMAGLAAIVIILFILLFSGGGAPATETENPDAGDVNSEVPAPGSDVDETEVEGDTADDATDDTAEADVVVNLTGELFAFSQDEIRANVGDTVTINFESDMGQHDWVVDEFDARTEIVTEADGMTSVTFVADTAGEFEYYCSVGMHRDLGMVGTLIVE